MLAEIITIGDEILIGQIVDTNATFIAQKLTKIGVKVSQITSVQDEQKSILYALEEAKKRVDIVVVTGGLGPTKDDITKQTFCDFFGDTLVENKELTKHNLKLYKKYTKGKLLPSAYNQSLVPSKATILKNNFGTAPGIWMKKENTVFISLPGVPYEMKHLMKNEVIPQIVKQFDLPYIYHKTLLTHGMGESEIASRIFDWEENLSKNIKLAYLPSLGRVRLRLSTSGKEEKKVKKLLNEQMKKLQTLLQDNVIGFEDETSVIEQIASIFIKNKQTLSVVESCTGGTIAQQFTAKAGASAFFMGSLVPYKTELKIQVLGVNKATINTHTVVSKEVVEEMARQSQKLFHSQYAISTTGVAGPTTGDTEDEPGTVFIAIATPTRIFSEKFMFGKPRERVITKTTNKALEMLYKEILKK